MARGVAVRRRELISVALRYRTFAIEEELFRGWIVGERIKITTKRLRVTERATRIREVLAPALDADGLHKTPLRRSEVNLQRRRPSINVTAALTYRAMIK